MKSIEVFFMPHPPLALPDIGQGKERGIEATIEGMKKVAQKIAHIRPETIIYITPHGHSFSNGVALLYEDNVTGDFSMFGYRDIKRTKVLNKSMTDDLNDAFDEADLTSLLLDHKTAKHYKLKVELDHGVLVPMHYIDTYYEDYEIVHITTSYQDLFSHYSLGVAMKEVIERSTDRTVVVCSGDLSHALKNDGPYDFHPYGLVFDQLMVEAIQQKDPSILMNIKGQAEKEAAQCGLRSFVMGFGLMDSHDYQSEVFSYEGPFGVGYLTGYLVNDFTSLRPSYLEVLRNKKTEAYDERCAKEDDYIRVARASINKYVNSHHKLTVDEVEDQLTQEGLRSLTSDKAAAFVSIHKDHNLRGCIGTTSPTADNLFEEIVYCAISACSSDPRFNPVDPDELMDLEIKVDRLYPVEPIHDLYELDAQKYGVIVEQGSKKGLLLPRLEGVDTVEEQIRIAKQKAGITSDMDIDYYRFEVERHEVK